MKNEQVTVMSLGATSKIPVEEFNPLKEEETSPTRADTRSTDLERRCTQALLTVLPHLRQLINREGESLSITVQQYTVLKALAEQKRLISELADLLKVSRPTMSRIIDGLEGRRRSSEVTEENRRPKLVERVACQDDHRLVYAHITEEGMATLRHYHNQAEDNIRSVLCNLEADELAALLRSLENLSQVLKQS
jgi:DNA-binding MarR family transcriptional regulator